MQPLEKVLEDEEDDDNSFDHRDDMSESLPTVDGGSGSQRGDEVDDGTSKAKKAKTGGKKAGVTLSPKCKIARGKRANCWKHFKIVNVPSKKERVSWRQRQSVSSAIGVMCTIQVVLQQL